jgi:hypothetical protein
MPLERDRSLFRRLRLYRAWWLRCLWEYCWNRLGRLRCGRCLGGSGRRRETSYLLLLVSLYLRLKFSQCRFILRIPEGIGIDAHVPQFVVENRKGGSRWGLRLYRSRRQCGKACRLDLGLRWRGWWLRRSLLSPHRDGGEQDQEKRERR